MKAPIVAVPSVSNALVASSITRPGRNDVCIQQLEESIAPASLASNIEFENDESVSSIKWIRLANTAATPYKKRRNSDTNGNTDNSAKYTDSLVILLATGEILIYSTSTKEFVNKISTDSPFAAIEVINKLGYSKKALYNYDYDLIAFDAVASALKFFSSSSPQLINSVPFKEDANISYILFNSSILEDDASTDVELILASNDTIYLLNKTHEVTKTIDISILAPATASPTKSSKNTEKESIPMQSTIEKIVKNGTSIYITRSDSPVIQIVDIEKKHTKKTKHKVITASDNLTDFSLLDLNKSDIVLSATLSNGSIELFKIGDKKSFAKLEIDGGNDIGRFVGLLNADGNGIIDGVYKGIWYDNFNVKITDFEFEDISKLDGTLQINVAELVDPKDENLDFDDVEEEEDEDEDDDDDEADDTEMTEHVDEYTCTELTQVVGLLRTSLADGKNEEYDVTLSHILAKNTTFAKSAIYLLTVDESVLLFNKIAFIVSHYEAQTLNQDFEFISNIKSWLQWLLVLRGNSISKNAESVGWLKLLQSEFKQEQKTLNGMIKLTGKLSLLKDQLNVRKEMMSRNGEEDVASDDSDDENAETGYTIDETTFGDSVVLDGEGGYDDDEDDDEDADDNDN